MQKQCNICFLEKDISEFYKQNWWVMWVKWECKECYKIKRRTEKYRLRDRNRYHNNLERNKQCKEHNKKWRELNPEKRKAQVKVWNYLRNKKSIHPKECCICLDNKNLHYHHEDYNFPNKVYSLCNICHANIHAWNIELDKSKEITLDFSNKRNKVFIKCNDWVIRTPKELSEMYWIKRYTILQRYRKWFSFDKIIFNWNLQRV